MQGYTLQRVLVAVLMLGTALPLAAQQKIDPSDIVVPEGYSIEAIATGLDYPSDIAFGPDGAMYVAEVGGHTYGTGPQQAPPARILRIDPDGTREVIFDDVVPLEVIREAESGEPIPAEGLIPPITGITWHEGLLYVSHRTRYSTLDPETGEFNTIIDAIPSWGEFQNNKPIFGPDGKMYFFLSTQGNSGTVDGHWIEVIDIFNKPNAHESPCEDVQVTGLDFWLDNVLTEEEGDSIRAEVYVPLGVNTEYGETIEGQQWCHGTMYRADPDGSNIERIAWGFRSNFGYNFSSDGRLITTQNSGNIMAPRPIYEDWEPVYEVIPGEWYGWPDYYSGLPVTDERFTRPNDPEFEGEPFPHDFSLTEATRQRLLKGRTQPVQPLLRLPVHSAAEGFVFGRPAFGLSEDEILVAEFGAIIPYYKDTEWPGFRVQKANIETGEISDFLVNESKKPAWATDGGGLRRPLQAEWGPDGALYVVDFGVIHFSEQGMNAEPNTGIIWKVVHRPEEEDATAPECALLERMDNGIKVRVRDNESGLASIEVLKDQNAEVSWPDFDAGTTDQVVVTATKVNPEQRSMVVLEVEDMAGNTTVCDPVVTTVSAQVPEAFELAQNYPNPFNPATRITFRLAEASDVRLAVYDALGREVAVLVSNQMEAGTYEVAWDGRDASGRMLPSGVYLYRIEAGSFTESRTMTLLK